MDVSPTTKGEASGRSEKAAQTKETDGNGATVRAILFHCKKAFHLIDHRILVEKLCRLNLPIRIINWITDFLSNRFQRIKLSEGCYSKWGSVPSGVPQGRKLGPWLFLVLINDLDVDNLANVWIYVDDTTASEVVAKGNQSCNRRSQIRLRRGLRRIESNSIATSVRSSEHLL